MAAPAASTGPAGIMAKPHPLRRRAISTFSDGGKASDSCDSSSIPLANGHGKRKSHYTAHFPNDSMFALFLDDVGTKWQSVWELSRDSDRKEKKKKKKHRRTTLSQGLLDLMNIGDPAVSGDNKLIKELISKTSKEKKVSSVTAPDRRMSTPTPQGRVQCW